MVASQTQKRNNSEQLVPINPDNNAQTNKQKGGWFIIGMELAGYGKVGR